MIPDEQRCLARQSVPTGGLEPEVILIEGVPHRLLSAHQCLVGAVEGVFGGGGDALTDEALDWTSGLAARPRLRACWLDRCRIVFRPGVASGRHRGPAVAVVLRRAPLRRCR